MSTRAWGKCHMFAQRQDGKETSTPGANATDVPSSPLCSRWIKGRRDTGSSDGVDTFRGWSGDLRQDAEEALVVFVKTQQQQQLWWVSADAEPRLHFQTLCRPARCVLTCPRAFYWAAYDKSCFSCPHKGSSPLLPPSTRSAQECFIGVPLPPFHPCLSHQFSHWLKKNI